MGGVSLSAKKVLRIIWMVPLSSRGNINSTCRKLHVPVVAKGASAITLIN